MKFPVRIICTYLIFTAFVFCSKIAVATKIQGLVEIIPSGNKKFVELKPGTILSDGDKLRTGSSGFAAIIFIDDKSTLKLKANSEVVITGQRSAKRIAKKINIDSGTVRASVNKQNTEFVIQTPTSVASVKGTDFWIVTDPVSGDQIICVEGIVGLVNIETGEEVDVTEDMTCISMPDGTLSLEETDPNSVPDDPSDEEGSSSQIKVYLEGPNGEQNILIIDYQ